MTDLPGTIYFPGMEPPFRAPGKITVTRAAPQTIEELEGMKDDNSERCGNKTNPKLEAIFDKLPIRELPPAPQASPESVRAPAPEAQGEQTDKKDNDIRAIKTDNKGKTGKPYFFIKATSGLLASLAALMSWYYSFEWFKDKLPGAWRFFLPIIIVGCSVLLPEVALILLGRKGWKPKAAAPGVFVIGLLASGFSMLSTIAGIYNSNSEAINRKSSALISSQTDEDARHEVERLDLELARLNREIDSTQAKVDAIPTDETLKPDSQALMRRLNNAKREKQTYETQRTKAQSRIDEARAAGYTSQTVREDFNSFLGRIFKTDPGRIEFGMAAAPALLLDVVSPILAAVALFL